MHFVNKQRKRTSLPNKRGEKKAARSSESRLRVFVVWNVWNLIDRFRSSKKSFVQIINSRISPEVGFSVLFRKKFPVSESKTTYPSYGPIGHAEEITHICFPLTYFRCWGHTPPWYPIFLSNQTGWASVLHALSLLLTATAIWSRRFVLGGVRSHVWLQVMRIAVVCLLLLGLLCGPLSAVRVSNNEDRKAAGSMGSGGVVRVGHLLPNNPAILHEPEILRMCALDLKERKILPKNFTLQWVPFPFNCRHSELN